MGSGYCMGHWLPSIGAQILASDLHIIPTGETAPWLNITRDVLGKQMPARDKENTYPWQSRAQLCQL